MTKPITHPIKEITRITIHLNGKDRKRKVMAHTDQGMVSARRAYYSYHHPDWDLKGKIIHLDNDDLNFDPNNLVLLSEREANTLVHFNNNLIVHNNPELQSQVIDQIRASIALQELDKEVNISEQRFTKSN